MRIATLLSILFVRTAMACPFYSDQLGGHDHRHRLLWWYGGLFVWAALRGQFRNVENAKTRMLFLDNHTKVHQ